MKQNIQQIIKYLIIALAALLAGRIYGKMMDRASAAERTAKLPAFSFRGLDGQSFSSDSLKGLHDVVVINYFNPGCDQCQDMATLYATHADLLKNARLVMITSADSASTRSFVKKYNLDKLHNLEVALDPKGDFQKIFGSTVVPSFFIYQNGQLVKKVTGETSIENLLNPHG